MRSRLTAAERQIEGRALTNAGRFAEAIAYLRAAAADIADEVEGTFVNAHASTLRRRLRRGDPIELLSDRNGATGMAWSPDRRQITIVHMGDNPTGANFLGLPSRYVCDADGTELRLVHAYVDGIPSWVPR